MWLNGVWLHHIVGINGLCEDIYLFHMLFSWDISQRNENHKRERKLTRKLNQFLVCHCKGCNESTNVLFRLFCWMLKPFIFNPKYLNMSLTNKLSHKIHYHLHFTAFILQCSWIHFKNKLPEQFSIVRAAEDTYLGPVYGRKLLHQDWRSHQHFHQVQLVGLRRDGHAWNISLGSIREVSWPDD